MSDELCPPNDKHSSLTPMGQNLYIRDLNKSVFYKIKNEWKGNNNKKSIRKLRLLDN